MKKLLVILLDKFQDIELTVFISLIKKANIFTEIAFFNPENKLVTGQFEIVKIQAQNHWKASDFSAVFIPGGFAAQIFRTCEKSINLVSEFFKENKHVFAICDAPNVIFELGIAKGYQFSSYPNEGNLSNKFRTNSSVCVDRNYISARNASSSAEFAFKVIENFGSPELSQKIKSGFEA
ncbi:DJ-1/PfpI family protein [Mycoplasma sp. 'Moose RK']|uniref:DJ-1/PfpI family protein n=1 Tax=Mycoplasma sp. 'Moose RK' TaxID=2780095 RepID=UPI0018C2AD9C|nr:DJ-1/PfpI family protein [Mycoplasma sp. 'Moose RK']MBG0730976.1 DJ-1/PfpI family protein [Mycoplasma sp. 'Moose RK']